MSLGVSYKFGDKEIDFTPRPIPQFQKYNVWNVMVALGIKNYEHGSPNYLKMTFGLNYLRAINYKYRIGFGLDMFYSAIPELRTETGNADFSDTFSFAVVPN